MTETAQDVLLFAAAHSETLVLMLIGALSWFAGACIVGPWAWATWE